MLLNGTLASDCVLAAETLAAGQLVAIPTETVYGLAADACSDSAVARIFAAKGRPSDHPLIVHLTGVEAVSQFASEVPTFAAHLMQRFWPGPLTLILPRRPGVASAAAGGQASVGVRSPSHPVAQALLLACAERGVAGLAAPSANLFGRISPTCAAHVQADFGESLPVLDGGPCSVGIESTIVDCTRGGPVLLRPGHITAHEIEQVTGLRVCRLGEPLQFDLVPSTAASSSPALAQPAPKASGTLEAHYAPRARVVLLESDKWLAQVALSVRSLGADKVGVYSHLSPEVLGLPWQAMPELASACAQELFAVLRAFDEKGVEVILVEQPPAGQDWDGVRDRLQRAAASA